MSDFRQNTPDHSGRKSPPVTVPIRFSWRCGQRTREESLAVDPELIRLQVQPTPSRSYPHPDDVEPAPCVEDLLEEIAWESIRATLEREHRLVVDPETGKLDVPDETELLGISEEDSTELERLLEATKSRTRLEGLDGGAYAEDVELTVTLGDVLRFARRFANLGTAVGDQAIAVLLDGECLEDQSPNALRRAHGALEVLRDDAELETNEESLERFDEILNELGRVS